MPVASKTAPATAAAVARRHPTSRTSSYSARASPRFASQRRNPREHHHEGQRQRVVLIHGIEASAPTPQAATAMRNRGGATAFDGTSASVAAGND